MNCKIKTFEWIILLFLMGVVDIIQIILDFFAIGVIINRIIDIVVGFCLPLYFWIRGVSMTNWKRLLIYFGAFVGEEIPVVDALPLWCLDVILVWLTVIAEKKIAKVPVLGKAMNVMNKMQQPLNKDGVRLPPPRIPVNQGGIRPPSLPSTISSRPMNIDGIRSPLKI